MGYGFKALFNHGDDVLEVIIRDQMGNKIDTRRCNMSDEEEMSRILTWLKTKYGIKSDNFLDMDNEFVKF